MCQFDSLAWARSRALRTCDKQCSSGHRSVPSNNNNNKTTHFEQLKRAPRTLCYLPPYSVLTHIRLAKSSVIAWHAISWCIIFTDSQIHGFREAAAAAAMAARPYISRSAITRPNDAQLRRLQRTQSFDAIRRDSMVLWCIFLPHFVHCSSHFFFAHARAQCLLFSRN